VIEDKNRQLKHKDVYIMQMLDEFGKKRQAQQKIYDTSIQNFNTERNNMAS
jgi:hypothetical protein